MVSRLRIDSGSHTLSRAAELTGGVPSTAPRHGGGLPLPRGPGVAVWAAGGGLGLPTDRTTRRAAGKPLSDECSVQRPNRPDAPGVSGGESLRGRKAAARARILLQCV